MAELAAPLPLLRLVRDEASPAYDGQERRAPFCMVPRALIVEHGATLGTSGLAIYAVLAAHADRDGQCWPSYETMSTTLGIGRATISRAIRTLVSLGYLTVKQRPSGPQGRGSNVYHLTRWYVSPQDLPMVVSSVVTHGKFCGDTEVCVTTELELDTLTGSTTLTASRPNEPKPRTPKQQASDALFERRSAFYGAYCRGLGIQLDSTADRSGRNRAFKELKPVLDAVDISPPEFERLTRYAKAGYTWRQANTTPSVGEVLKASTEWEAAGRPDAPETNGTRRSAEQTQAHINRGGNGFVQ